MFSVVYQLMRGELEELPRRRRDGISYDPVAGAFVADEAVDHREPWPGRGEVPGAPMRDVAVPTEGITIADEMRQLSSGRADRP